MGGHVQLRGDRPATIRVVIVDGHTLVVDGLRAMLETTGHCSVVATASHSADGLRMVETQGPDVLLVDLRLPDGRGIELIRQVRRRVPTVKIVVVTTSDDPLVVAAAIEAGIHAYVVKTSGRQELLQAIGAAHSGSPYLDKDARKAYEAWATAPVTLAETEVELLKNLSTGLHRDELGAVMNMSRSTVNRQLRSIATKLGVSNAVSAVAEATRRGLI